MEAEIQDIRKVESHSPFETQIFAPSLEAKYMKHIQEEIKLLLKFDSTQELVHSFEASPYDGNEPLSIIALATFSSNNELVFEFFEFEQPQLRKPLHNKIMELINNGNSNHQAFGEPSKLACMKLHELHPASWNLADKVASVGFNVVVPDFFCGDPFLPETNRLVWIKMHGTDKGFEDAKPTIAELRSKSINVIRVVGFRWDGENGYTQ